jgi:uncharacterized membrane protein
MILKLTLIAIPVFLVIDLVWLGVVARGFYAKQLGSLMARQVNWWAAFAFYLIFVVGLVFFVIEPAVAADSLSDALWRGAFFGFVTYATYDLTNLATTRDWPPLMTAVDLVWGTFLAASVAIVTFQIWKLFE